jgi:hypothetical protein
MLGGLSEDRQASNASRACQICVEESLLAAAKRNGVIERRRGLRILRFPARFPVQKDWSVAQDRSFRDFRATALALDSLRDKEVNNERNPQTFRVELRCFQAFKTSKARA